MVVTAYPVARKAKSQEICLAFARGCGGQVAGGLREGAAFFYGVDASNIDLYHAARNRFRDGISDFFYCDNSYFDSARQEKFRIAKNALQHSGTGVSDCARFDALGLQIKPWRDAGAHIVVCPQSEPFMRDIAGYQGDWARDVRDALAGRTKREVRVRAWNRDKGALSATLKDDLAGAHALVTWSSAAAITAILEGIPAFVMSNDCAARPMAAGELSNIESPRMPNGRREWAGVLADQEWSLDEFRSGAAWRALNRG